ncbi:MAG: hypothetical protein ACI9FJ_002300 [Alteromonadaceae bacterium]|jgi:hypothetical protein
MWFWIKNLILVIGLGGAAIYLLTYQDSAIQTVTTKTAKTISKNNPVTAKEDAQGRGTFSSTSSGAAKGLSDFYGKVKEELLGNGKTIGDGFVLKLDKPTLSVDEQLQNRAQIVTPGSYKFTGEVEDRHFRSGETIKDILSEYAAKEGIVLIWRLEKDYIIKHYFQVESNLVSTIGSVAKALDSDFERDVFGYYCPRERAAVITYDSSSYLKSNCKLAGKK